MALRRSFLILSLICLGCSAQSVSPDLSKRIERQVRATYSLPVDVQVTVGPAKPSEFPNYDALNITLSTSERKQEVPFLVSKDGKTLIRMTKMDLSQDPYAELMKKIDTNGRPTRGKKDAKVVAVNYDDFQCPYCSRMHQELFPTIFKEYGDRVLFIYINFSLRGRRIRGFRTAPAYANAATGRSPGDSESPADSSRAKRDQLLESANHPGSVRLLPECDR